MTQLALQPFPARRGKPRLVALPGGAEAPVPAARAVTAPGSPDAGPAPASAPTLGAVLSTLVAALGAGAPAACPMCGGRMEPLLATAVPSGPGGRCRDCGTSLD